MSDKATVELVACPFCGATADYYPTQEWEVVCQVCPCGMRTLEEWNTRALPTPTDASGLLEALGKAIAAKLCEYDGRPQDWFRYHDPKGVYLKVAQEVVDKALAQHREGKQWSDEVPTERDALRVRANELKELLKEVMAEKSVRFEHKMWCSAAKCASGCGKLLAKKVFKAIEESDDQ